MRRNQVPKEWHTAIVNKLQERYGLTEEQAIQKTDVWLQWIGKQQAPRSQALSVEALDQHPASRNSSLLGPSKARSRSAGRS
jgi:hypothetical protein